MLMTLCQSFALGGWWYAIKVNDYQHSSPTSVTKIDFSSETDSKHFCHSSLWCATTKYFTTKHIDKAIGCKVQCQGIFDCSWTTQRSSEPWLSVENFFQMNENGTINVAKSGDTIYYDDYRVILNIFKTAYFHIFGELFIDEKLHVMDPSECQSTLGNGFEILVTYIWWHIVGDECGRRIMSVTSS